MAASGTITINGRVSYTHVGALGNYQGTSELLSTLTLTTADINLVYAASYSTASTQNLDLSAGTLTDDYGTALVFARCEGFVIQNTHATASLTIGGGANALFGTDQYTVKAGKTLPITSVFNVDGTHHIIRIVPSATATFKLLILGSFTS